MFTFQRNRILFSWTVKVAHYVHVTKKQESFFIPFIYIYCWKHDKCTNSTTEPPIQLHCRQPAQQQLHLRGVRSIFWRRSDIINRIKLENKLYASVGQIILNMRGCEISAWLEDMADLNQFPDELMIYTLSRTYNRHTMIILKDRNWSTVSSDNPISEDELWSICHVHLAYLGNGVFAKVKIKPFEGPHKDPITMEALARALNKIRGKGRPRSQPLNLVIKPSFGNSGASTSNCTEPEESTQDQNTSTMDDTITPVPEDIENIMSTVSDGTNTNQGENPTVTALSESGIKGNNIESSDHRDNHSANT